MRTSQIALKRIYTHGCMHTYILNPNMNLVGCCTVLAKSLYVRNFSKIWKQKRNKGQKHNIPLLKNSHWTLISSEIASLNGRARFLSVVSLAL